MLRIFEVTTTDLPISKAPNSEKTDRRLNICRLKRSNPDLTITYSYTWGRFHQTFSPSEKLPVHDVWQKIAVQFYKQSSTDKLGENSPKYVRHAPNAVRQQRSRILHAQILMKSTHGV
jgi:hypothetical protein